jgi:hypothetical protein
MAISDADLAAFHALELPQARTAVAPKHKGNFLTSILPTIGGTAGGIGGGAAGGALAGTAILPGVGTVAGGLLGALLGGAGGGALGKVAENKVEGNAMGDGVLGAGIENGVLSAGPLRLLKGAGAVTKAGGEGLLGALAKPVAAHSAEALAGDAAQVAATPLKTSAAGKLESWGNNQLAKQWGTLDKPTIRATNPTRTVGQLADMGIIKPQDAERIAQGLTGSSGLLNQAVVKAVGSSGKVPISGVSSVLDKSLAEHGLVEKDAASVRQVVEAQLGKLGDGASADPDKVLNVMKSIESRIANLGGKGGNYRMATPERLDQAKALQAVHKELEDSLYKAAGADEKVASVLTPDVEKGLLALHPGNPQWTAHVEKIMNSKTIGELRSHQSPLVKASQMIDNAHDNSFSMGGKIGDMLSGGGFKSAIVNTAANVVKDPALRAAGNTARKLAGSDTAQAGNLLSALSAPTKKGIIRNEVLGNMATNMLQSDKTAGAAPLDPNTIGRRPVPTIDTVTGAGTTTQSDFTTPTPLPSQQQQNTSMFSPENAEAGIQSILAHGGKMSDVTAYVGLVQALSDMKAKANPTQKPLNATQQQQSSNAQSGLSSLDEIAGTLQNNPKASLLNALPGGAVMHNLVGTGSYDAAIQNATDVIGRLRSGGAISGDEEKRFLKMLPKAGDNSQTVQYKLNSVRNLFSSFAYPQAAADDQASLLSALGAQ